MSRWIQHIADRMAKYHRRLDTVSGFRHDTAQFRASRGASDIV
jgi:hypothetical protein